MHFYHSGMAQRKIRLNQKRENVMGGSDNSVKRTWEVLLIGGASGTGKTSISYRIAQHFGVGITEVDDFHELLLRMTTPEQQPALHFWNTHPEAVHLSAEEIVEQGWDVRAALHPGLEAVIANHLESCVPIIL